MPSKNREIYLNKLKLLTINQDGDSPAPVKVCKNFLCMKETAEKIKSRPAIGRDVFPGELQPASMNG